VEEAVDVIVEGIDDLQTIEAVERAVTSAVERAGPVGVETSLGNTRPPSRGRACPRCGMPLKQADQEWPGGRLRVGNPPRPSHVAAELRCPICGSCGTAAAGR
jgi:hypothetical protein